MKLTDRAGDDDLIANLGRVGSIRAGDGAGGVHEHEQAVGRLRIAVSGRSRVLDEKAVVEVGGIGDGLEGFLVDHALDLDDLPNLIGDMGRAIVAVGNLAVDRADADRGCDGSEARREVDAHIVRRVIEILVGDIGSIYRQGTQFSHGEIGARVDCEGERPARDDGIMHAAVDARKGEPRTGHIHVLGEGDGNATVQWDFGSAVGRHGVGDCRCVVTLTEVQRGECVAQG